MSSMRHLKDANKGLRKRLERAEALLAEATVPLRTMYYYELSEIEADNTRAFELHNKIIQFIS